MKTKSIVLILLLLVPLAHAVRGGNTGLYLPTNDNGELIKIQFGAKHPLEDKVKELLNEVELPSTLKAEMVVDFEETAVILSGETITYGSFQDDNSPFKKLTKIREIENRDHNGNTSITIEKEYDVAEIAREIGLTMYEMDIEVNNLKKTYLAALTTKYPRAVIYFSTFTNQLSERELLTLVLHEQAHRLKFLNRNAESEHFVEAWARSLVSYFYKEISTEDFYNILKKNNLLVSTEHGLTDVLFEDHKQVVGKEKVVIYPNDISFIHSTDYFQLQSDVFGSPILKALKFVDVYHSLNMNRDYVYIPELFINYLTNLNGPIVLDIYITLLKNIVVQPDNRKFYQYQFLSASLDIELKKSDKTPSVYKKYEEVAGKNHKFAHNNELYDSEFSNGASPIGRQLYNTMPEVRLELDKLVQNIDAAFSSLKKNSPLTYRIFEMLSPSQGIHLNLSNGVYGCDKPMKNTINLTSDFSWKPANLLKPSYAYNAYLNIKICDVKTISNDLNSSAIEAALKIFDQVTLDEWKKYFETTDNQEQVNERSQKLISRVLNDFGIDLKLKTPVSNIDSLLDLLNQGDEFFNKLGCVIKNAKTSNKLIININNNTASNMVSWNLPMTENYDYVLNLNIKTVVDHNFQNSFNENMASTMLSVKSLLPETKKYNSGFINKATWNSSKASMKMPIMRTSSRSDNTAWTTFGFRESVYQKMLTAMTACQ